MGACGRAAGESDLGGSRLSGHAVALCGANRRVSSRRVGRVDELRLAGGGRRTLLGLDLHDTRRPHSGNLPRRNGRFRQSRRLSRLFSQRRRGWRDFIDFESRQLLCQRVRLERRRRRYQSVRAATLLSGWFVLSGASIPDVSIDADPETGVAVYDTYDNGTSTPWVQVGGTSLACPLWAGIIATVDQERVAVGAGILDGATQTLPMLYSLPSTDFHDITTGNNGLPAGPGHDQVTGIGSPIVPSIVQGMLPQIAVTPFSPSTLSLAEEGNPVLDASGNSVIQVSQFKDLRATCRRPTTSRP